MSEKQQHIHQYTAADIQQYLQGKLSSAEMYALEKAALDDPFLADAIEGMEQAMQEHGEPAVLSELETLKAQVQQRIGPGGGPSPVLKFHWWQAAAAVLLIAAGVYAYNSFFSRPPVNALATTEHERAKTVSPIVTDSQAQQMPSLSDTMAAPQDQAAILPPVSQNNTVPPTTVLPDQASAPSALNGRVAGLQVSPSAKKTPPPALRDANIFRIDTMAPVVASQPVPDPAQPPAIADAALLARQQNELRNNLRQMEAKSKAETEVVSVQDDNDKLRKASQLTDNTQKDLLQNVIKGQVVDNYNRPLANAYVQTDITQHNFVTDKNGYFNIPATDSVLNVSVGALGFASQQVRLRQNQLANQVQLQPSQQALGEVVVVGYGSKRRKLPTGKTGGIAAGKASDPSILVQDTEPVYGWVGYEQYLSKNKKTPAVEPALSGDVVITFMVNRNGEQYNYKVERSLSKAYDEEALRLVKEGPKWKVLKGRKAKATVIVKF